MRFVFIKTFSKNRSITIQLFGNNYFSICKHFSVLCTSFGHGYQNYMPICTYICILVVSGLYVASLHCRFSVSCHSVKHSPTIYHKCCHITPSADIGSQCSHVCVYVCYIHISGCRIRVHQWRCVHSNAFRIQNLS